MMRLITSTIERYIIKRSKMSRRSTKVVAKAKR